MNRQLGSAPPSTNGPAACRPGDGKKIALNAAMPQALRSGPPMGWAVVDVAASAIVVYDTDDSV